MKFRFVPRGLLGCVFLVAFVLSACQSAATVVDDHPFCTTEMLRSSSVMEGATGFTYASINYTNVSGAACKLRIPPEMHYTDNAGVGITVEGVFDEYVRDTNTVEYTFEETSSGDEVILPASETAQLRLRWVGFCLPVTADGLVVHLTLASSQDILRTKIFDGARTCAPEHLPPQVQTTGFIRVVDN